MSINAFQDLVNNFFSSQIEQGKATIVGQIFGPFIQFPWLTGVITFLTIIGAYLIIQKITRGLKWKKGRR